MHASEIVHRLFVDVYNRAYGGRFVCGRVLGAAPGYRSCADQMDLLFHDVLEYEIVQVCSTKLSILVAYTRGLNAGYRSSYAAPVIMEA